MPFMDGFQLAREFWKVDTNAKICFLTAFEIYEEEAKKVFPSLNGYCFIKKPIGIQALANHIRSHLQEDRWSPHLWTLWNFDLTLAQLLDMTNFQFNHQKAMRNLSNDALVQLSYSHAIDFQVGILLLISFQYISNYFRDN